MTRTGGWATPMDDDPFHDLVYRDPELVRFAFDDIVSTAGEPAERRATPDQNAGAPPARPANPSHLEGADGAGLTQW